MHRLFVPLFCLLTLAISTGEAAEDGFRDLFNGKDLEGWEGVPGLWKVSDGAIVGETTPTFKVKNNTFLIWKGGQPSDFELHFDVRLPSTTTNNSGVLYRSNLVTTGDLAGYFVLKGYQCDVQTGWEHYGKMYEEGGRGRIGMAGQKVEVPIHCKAKGQKVLGESAPVDQVKAAEKKGDWNSFAVIAKGNHVQHFLNGVLVLDLTDLDDAVRPVKGLIGLQVHAGAPMRIEFRNLRLREFAP